MINTHRILLLFSRRILCLILLFAFFWTASNAQELERRLDSVQDTRVGPDNSGRSVIISGDTIQGVDSLATKKRTANLINGDSLEHSPMRAMYLALALPGLGQIYNKKYFKVPIVYAAFAGVGYWIHYNVGQYRLEIENYTSGSTSSDQGIYDSRRTLEISIITLVGVYGLQALDAYVDAHLFYWDVNPDLTIKMEPAVTPFRYHNSHSLASYGLRFTMNF